MADPATPDLLTLTAEIVVAHVAGNKLAPDEVPALISVVYGALAQVDVPVVV
jgi:predicted transcriptional regulator